MNKWEYTGEKTSNGHFGDGMAGGVRLWVRSCCLCGETTGGKPHECVLEHILSCVDTKECNGEVVRAADTAMIQIAWGHSFGPLK